MGLDKGDKTKEFNHRRGQRREEKEEGYEDNIVLNSNGV